MAMGADDIAGLIVAVTGFLVWLSGRSQNRRGQQAQQVQQATANQLQGQAQEFTQQQAIIENLNRENARLIAEIDRKDRIHATENVRCVEVRSELAATLTLVSDIVRDEVAKSMVETVLEKSDRHTDTDH